MKKANSFDLLLVLQDIRRAHPDTTDAMDVLIDVISDGDVSFAMDVVMKRIGCAIYDKGKIYKVAA